MRKQYGKISDDALARRYRRRLSIRKNLSGTAECPRVCAVKSNKHLRVQVVDDSTNKVLFSVQTFGKNRVEAGPNKDGAKIVGAKVGEKLKEYKILNAVFDRAGYKFTGVIASLVDGIKEAGVKI